MVQVDIYLYDDKNIIILSLLTHVFRIPKFNQHLR